MSFAQKIQDGFFKNPFAWLMVTAFAVAEYGNYQRSKELARVCDLLGPHDVYIDHPTTARQEIDNICISRMPDD
jgi:hypothetical protein